MALFRCASGSSGGGATITVTYSSDFYGETVTCSHGTKTYSKVATSSGTLEFSVDEEGTWTISCTIGGDTFTTTADVDLTYDAELVSLPNGETVLPTDDIETWLACAGITDKAYTTLSQVLGDSETFNALLGDSNACAYMKRSTTWAGDSSVRVPVMTSNTAPEGTCIYTSELSGRPAYKAFTHEDNPTTSANDMWFSNSQTTPVYLGYQFTRPVVVNKVKVLFGLSGYPNTSTTFTFQGSSTGNSDDWHDIGSAITNTETTIQEYSFDNDTAYSYYRIYITDQTVSGANYKGAVNILQFLYEGLTTNQLAMNLLGQYDTACDALLSDATWASAIANSTYVDSVLNVKVPAMTSNTTPSGECFASTEYDSSYRAYLTFDGNTSNSWKGRNEANPYVGYKFTSKVRVAKVYFTNKGIQGINYRALTYKFQGSDTANSDDWHDISEIYTNQNNINYETNHILTIDSSKYQYIRCYVVTRNNVNEIDIGGLQFYGRTPSSEKIHGGNPTYDSFYRIVDGNNVPVTDPSLLDAGTYTIYSNGLAKDPSDLSADYGKTVRICPNTKEIVVRPDNALYWYGVERTEMTAEAYDGGYPYAHAPSITKNQTSLSITQAYSSQGNQRGVYISTGTFDFSTGQKVKLMTSSYTYGDDGTYDMVSFGTANQRANVYGLDIYASIPKSTADFSNSPHYFETPAYATDATKYAVITIMARTKNTVLGVDALWYE